MSDVLTVVEGLDLVVSMADGHVHPEHDAVRLRQALGDAALASPWVDVQKPIAVVVTERPWGTCYRVRAYPSLPKTSSGSRAT